MNPNLFSVSIVLFSLFLFFSYYQDRLSKTPYREASTALISFFFSAIIYSLISSKLLAVIIFVASFYVIYIWISFTPFNVIILYTFTVFLGLYLAVGIVGGILKVVFSPVFLLILILSYGFILAFFGWQLHKFFLINFFAATGAFIVAIFVGAIAGEFEVFGATFLIVFFLGVSSQYQKLSPDEKEIIKRRLDKIEPVVRGITPYISYLVELAENRKKEVEKDLEEYKKSREGKRYSDDFSAFVDKTKDDFQKKLDGFRKSKL